MPIIDYYSEGPIEEIQNVFKREANSEFAHFSSWKGRFVSVLKVVQHAVGIPLKPLIYSLGGTIFICSALFMKNHKHYKNNPHFVKRHVVIGLKMFGAGIAAPASQTMQLFKAVFGIIDPRIYFKKEPFAEDFARLADFARKAGCDQTLIEQLEKGSKTVEKTLSYNRMSELYRAQYKRDLTCIIEKMGMEDLSQEKRAQVLNMLSLEPGDVKSGLAACAPGLGRILEEMRELLDVPQENAEIIPWLNDQFMQEVIKKMVMQADSHSGKDDALPWQKALSSLTASDLLLSNSAYSNHRGNTLTSAIGPSIGLKKELIDRANKDTGFNFSANKEQKELLLKAFHSFYTKTALEEYILIRVNSQEDGSIGLQKFRLHVIEALSLTISEEELTLAKHEVMEKLHITEALADDPIFYLRAKYLLRPEDERSTDLTVEAIRKYAEALPNNPFSGFE